MRATAILLTLLIAVARVEGADPKPAPPIQLTARYRLGFAPADFPVKIRVEPNENNRKLCWEYDGGDYSRSCVDFDGKSPTYTTVWVKHLSAGDYTMRATITRADGSSSSSTLTFIVVSKDIQPEQG